MWRRVGDFDRIQVPQLEKYAELEKAIQYKEYMRNLQRQKEIHEYRQNILQQVNAPIFVEKRTKIDNKPIPVIEEKVIEEKVIEEGINIEESPVTNIEIIAVETEITGMESQLLTKNIEEKEEKEEKTPIVFPKKGKKRR
jgi:hypothetical protein